MFLFVFGRNQNCNQNEMLGIIVQTQPDVVYIQTQHPLIGLINSIGFKISNTADFFAGMLRGTIQVIKAHQRKQTQNLRKISAKKNKRKQKPKQKSTQKHNHKYIKSIH